MTHPAEQNIASVANALDDPAAQGLTRGQRLGRLVSSWIGSLPSVGVHVILLGAWIGTNRGMSASSPSFDPFPYSGLATILAIEMLILTLFILMNQAAMARQTERRGHLDLQLNLLAEQESTINLAILRHRRHFVALLGTRRKVGENLVVIRFAERGVVAAAARHQRQMDA